MSGEMVREKEKKESEQPASWIKINLKIPVLDQIRNYNRDWVLGDLTAGLVMTSLLFSHRFFPKAPEPVFMVVIATLVVSFLWPGIHGNKRDWRSPLRASHARPSPFKLR